MLHPLAHKVLELPAVFDTYQWLIGAPNCQRHFMSKYVAARAGQRVLDLGCGVGAGLRYLPDDVDYLGIDISDAYIERARQEHGGREFVVADITTEDPARFGRFDVAYAFGVLHHLSDDQVDQVATSVQRLLAPGGRFVSIDPCFRKGQGKVAHFLISHDRGEHVRNQSEYEKLLARYGRLSSEYVEGVLRIPYTQLAMQLVVGGREGGPVEVGVT